MPESKVFNPAEDQLIKYLYDELKIKKWSMVAKKMTEEYNIPCNAKQCRDRYRLHLDPLMQSEWTEEEEKYLYYLHNQVGNKWALIATYFPGKTDNCVKNHFYSKLRKSMRHLNKIIKCYFRRQFKELKIAAIYKIIEGFQQQFKEKPIVPKEVSNHCLMLKDALIAFSNENQASSQDECHGIEDYKKQKYLLTEIFEFCKNYKKKSKKQKRQTLQNAELFKPVVRMIEENDEQSSFSGVDSNPSNNSEPQEMISQREEVEEKDEIRKSPQIYVIVEDEELRSSANERKSQVQIRSELVSSGKISEEDNRNIFKDLLHASGSIDPAKLPFGFMRGQSSFRSFRSQSGQSESQKLDMFGEDIRLSAKLKQIQGEMEEEEKNLFRSQR